MAGSVSRAKMEDFRKGDDEGRRAERAGRRHHVRFLPEGVWVEAEAGASLLEVIRSAGLGIQSSCGGKGTCGKCLVRILSGKAEIRKANIPQAAQKQGYVLACQVIPQGPMTVEIPPESRVTSLDLDMDELEGDSESRIVGFDRYPLEPLVRRVGLSLSEPSLTENLPDLARLKATLKKATGFQDLSVPLEVLRTMPEFLRTSEWRVSVDLSDLGDGKPEILAVRPFRPDVPSYGLAIDIGTTTIAVYLVELECGKTLSKLASYNEQFLYGDDVISRIIHASSRKDGLEELRRAALRTVNSLVSQALKKAGVSPGDVSVAVIAGNTTMAHLFLGIDPKYIRLEPYIPAASEFPVVKAKDLGLIMNKEGLVVTMPAVASYVGGDIVAGMLVTGAGDSEEVNLFVDIGTNGEMVLGNKDWLVSCACSAGPCFEGGGITCGMRAMRGAINKVRIQPITLDVEFSVIGGTRPLGICGSGLIDLLAEMRAAGIIDSSGRIHDDLKSPRVRLTEDGCEFVVAWGFQTGVSRDIVITQADIENLMRAKAAVYAGIRCLLGSVGLEPAAISRAYVAGGFGSSVDIGRAVQIGMLPDLPRDKYAFVGNASVKGARLAVLSRPAWKAALQLARRMTYLELSVGTAFMDEFISAMFLPHTNAELFPSVRWGS